MKDFFFLFGFFFSLFTHPKHKCYQTLGEMAFLISQKGSANLAKCFWKFFHLILFIKLFLVFPWTMCLLLFMILFKKKEKFIAKHRPAS